MVMVIVHNLFCEFINASQPTPMDVCFLEWNGIMNLDLEWTNSLENKYFKNLWKCVNQMLNLVLK